MSMALRVMTGNQGGAAPEAGGRAPLPFWALEGSKALQGEVEGQSFLRWS